MRGTGFWFLMQKSLHAKDGKAKKNRQGPFIVRSLYPKGIVELTFPFATFHPHD
jgi:hypothetical protein